MGQSDARGRCTGTGEGQKGQDLRDAFTSAALNLVGRHRNLPKFPEDTMKQPEVVSVLHLKFIMPRLTVSEFRPRLSCSFPSCVL